MAPNKQDKSFVDFYLEGNLTGWVAVGFSNDENMVINVVQSAYGIEFINKHYATGSLLYNIATFMTLIIIVQFNSETTFITAINDIHDDLF